MNTVWSCKSLMSRSGPREVEAISSKSSRYIGVRLRCERSTSTATMAPSSLWLSVSSSNCPQEPVVNSSATCGKRLWNFASRRGNRPVADDSMAPMRNGPEGSAEGSTARLASAVRARIFEA
ncbi:hypothetical protein D3C78_1318650 [compost metagenome]